VTHCFRPWLRTAARVSLCNVVLVGASAWPARGQELMHGFVDPCTVENHQEMYTVCELCPVPSGDPQACSKRLGELGYEKKCSTVAGHHDGQSEVWCIAQAKAPGAAASAAPPGNSDAAPSPAPSNRLMFVGIPVLLGALALLARAWSRRAPKR
jgi:hypothetical protein